jgi:hypothetical protein
MYSSAWVTKLHGIISQKIGNLIINAVRILCLKVKNYGRQVKTEERRERRLKKFLDFARSSFL